MSYHTDSHDALRISENKNDLDSEDKGDGDSVVQLIIQDMHCAYCGSSLVGSDFHECRICSAVYCGSSCRHGAWNPRGRMESRWNAVGFEGVGEYAHHGHHACEVTDELASDMTDWGTASEPRSELSE